MNLETINDIPIDVLVGDPKQYDLDYYKMPDEKFEEIVSELYDNEINNIVESEQIHMQDESIKNDNAEIYDNVAINDDSSVSEIMNDAVYEELFDASDTILNDEILFDSMSVKNSTNNYIDGYRLTARNILTSSDLYSRYERFSQDDILGLTTKQAREILNISHDVSLHRLVKKGLIRTFKIRERLRFVTSDVYRLMNDQRRNKVIAIYARVWDVSQIRHVNAMREQIRKLLNFATEKTWPVKRIYRDNSFGLDYAPSTRKGLYSLLYDVIRGRVDFVLIESPDRLGMVGYELLVQLFKYYKTKIIFMNDTTANVQYRNEMIGEFSFLQKLLHKSVRQGKIVNTDVDLSKINYKDILKI